MRTELDHSEHFQKDILVTFKMQIGTLMMKTFFQESMRYENLNLLILSIVTTKSQVAN